MLCTNAEICSFGLKSWKTHLENEGREEYGSQMGGVGEVYNS